MTEQKTTHAVVSLCLDNGELGFPAEQSHVVRLFPSEAAANEWVLQRIIDYLPGWTWHGPSEVSVDGEIMTQDEAITAFQDSLESCQYFHVVRISKAR